MNCYSSLVRIENADAACVRKWFDPNQRIAKVGYYIASHRCRWQVIGQTRFVFRPDDIVICHCDGFVRWTKYWESSFLRILFIDEETCCSRVQHSCSRQGLALEAYHSGGFNLVENPYSDDWILEPHTSLCIWCGCCSLSDVGSWDRHTYLMVVVDRRCCSLVTRFDCTKGYVLPHIILYGILVGFFLCLDICLLCSSTYVACLAPMGLHLRGCLGWDQSWFATGG